MGRSPARVREARRFFERAAALDPENVDALAWLAHMDFVLVALGVSEDRLARLMASERTVFRALLLAPNHAFAHLVLGIDYLWTKRAAEALGEIEHALRLDRNLAFAHSYIGFAKAFCGRAEETEAHVLDALRISPRDHEAYLWMQQAALAKLMLGCDEDAVAWLRRSIEVNRSYPIAHFVLAAALINLGRVIEARAAMQAGLDLAPGATLGRVRAALVSENTIANSQWERCFDGMRRAGMPEG